MGAASIVVPVYLAELAPLEIRGMITGRNELAIVSGQLAAFVINAIIGIVLGDEEGAWRVMFFICAIPAAALFIGMLRMPESRAGSSSTVTTSVRSRSSRPSATRAVPRSNSRRSAA
ncbi:MFS transporter [Sphingomonas sp. LR61]|uniref:MFS transporter n=1 Tax=Sphingomonas sp. LR61 TaxID=3050234 RepID=UPI002FE051C6